jgi:hypothetical protein
MYFIPVSDHQPINRVPWFISFQCSHSVRGSIDSFVKRLLQATNIYRIPGRNIRYRFVNDTFKGNTKEEIRNIPQEKYIHRFCEIDLISYYPGGGGGGGDFFAYLNIKRTWFLAG